MGESRKILVINPGSTSTKLALFEAQAAEAVELFGETVEHPVDELDALPSLVSQKTLRFAAVRGFLDRSATAVSGLDAVAGRGGLLRPLEGGVYAVNDAMVTDLETGRYGEHASNLGAPIAREIAAEAGCPAFIVDPVVVDELDPASRLSGHPALPRRSIFHALNQRSVARLVARRIGKPYEEAYLIVAHLGGGISVGAHKRGRVVDVNNALDGEGPFTPERTGTLPAGPLVTLCFRGGYSEEEVRRMIKGRGGLMAYLGTTDFRILESRLASGDRRARTVFDAMTVQIAKEISSHGATLEGRVDAVVLTGGLAKSSTLVEALRSRLEWIAPVEVVPGEREMEALAEGALAALRGERPVKEYHP